MKIIYFTTAQDNDDYVLFCRHWKIALNASNQNFHNKIIRSLAINNEVHVISIRPYSRRNCTLRRLINEYRQCENITWHYVKIPRSPLLKTISIKKSSRAILKALDLKDTVIMTDTINPNVLNLANNMAKKFDLPIIGLCTDSPSNISGTSKTYTNFLLSLGRNLDGYVALTSGLNSLYNPNNKESIILEGIVEEEVSDKRIYRDYGQYFFFGGALLPRYGVYELIEAFKNIKDENINLLICGHHGNEGEINRAIGEDKRIKYLKCLPIHEVLHLESRAIANINPRPYSEDLDRFSIPSKTLEYLASGSLTITVKNTKLQKEFKECALWTKSNNPQDLTEAMNKALAMKEEERKEMAETAQNKVKELYSLTAVNKKINELISKIK